MHDDDEFLRSIPDFLRRTHKPPPRKLPVRPRDLPAARSQSDPRPAPTATPPAAPIAAPAAAQAPAPAAPAAPATSEAVEAAQPSAAEGPAAQRARIALAFDNPDMAENQDMTEGTDREDITFRITLPRGVARQICMLAVERDTTQRAVVLGALRLAGLSVPEGGDIDRPEDRRDCGAKRQA